MTLCPIDTIFKLEKSLKVDKENLIIYRLGEGLWLHTKKKIVGDTTRLNNKLNNKLLKTI